MARPTAPSMPTPKQVKDAFEMAKKLCPGVRLTGIGPDGIRLEYPKGGQPEWDGKAFGDSS